MVYKKSYKFHTVLKIPEGYKLLVKPDNLKVDNNLVKVTYETEFQDNDRVNINGLYEFKNDVYRIDDYVNLKGLFNIIVDKFNEKLVLVKI